jgi:tetratricopeptide (TPR) repeat protein
MKAPGFLFLFPLMTLVSGWALAQTSNSPTPNAAPPSALPHVVEVPQPEQPPAAAEAGTENLDPAKVAEYQKRFEQGYALEQQGKLAEARAIYDGILAEEPQAKRSLLEAGRISFELQDLTKADDYLEKLHALVPDFPEAMELLIQINQALKRDVKVELLLRDFRDLHESGKVPEFTRSLYFVRERIHLDQEEIVVSQFFDYMRDPNTVWMGEVFDAGGQLKQRLLLNYDPDTTKALRAKDPKFGDTQVFTWLGHVIKDQQVTQIDAYLQIFALPDYGKFRTAMLVILANPPKPIYSAPVNPSGG